MTTIVEHRKHPANTLTARSIKATLVLAADEILALSAPTANRDASCVSMSLGAPWLPI
jgi:hypothetical protein